MKKRRSIIWEGVSLFLTLCLFIFFASKTGLPFVIIIIITVVSFFVVVFPYFILLIDSIGRRDFLDFRNLEKDIEYKVLKKKGCFAEIELKNKRRIIVGDFKKYASFVNVGDYFVIKSFSPLNIEWIVRENASKEIDIFT